MFAFSADKHEYIFSYYIHVYDRNSSSKYISLNSRPVSLKPSLKCWKLNNNYKFKDGLKDNGKHDFE